MNLYQIDQEYQQILLDLYDDEGNVNQQALMMLEHNTQSLEKKAIAIASYVKNLGAEREAINKAKKEMADREKRNKKREDDLLGYLLSNMDKRGINKITCPYFEIRLKECPLSVDDDKLDMKELPDEYKRTKTEVLPDKIKILQEAKEGVVIPGVALKRNKTLEIR